jgi:hypothetical protein
MPSLSRKKRVAFVFAVVERRALKILAEHLGATIFGNDDELLRSTLLASEVSSSSSVNESTSNLTRGLRAAFVVDDDELLLLALLAFEDLLRLSQRPRHWPSFLFPPTRFDTIDANDDSSCSSTSFNKLSSSSALHLSLLKDESIENQRRRHWTSFFFPQTSIDDISVHNLPCSSTSFDKLSSSSALHLPLLNDGSIELQR